VVLNFFKIKIDQTSSIPLLKYNVSACIIIFSLLELWRPCYFLTDDNLSSLFPVFTEMGRHLKSWQSPFISEYLYGGHYDLSRDVGYLYWHPFYLIPALLSDTPFRFWILDAVALLFLLLTTVGFTFLANYLRSEYDSKVSNIALVFYTMSFMFSTYILMTGSSWINFLGNQSALPWLMLGMLDKKIVRGTLLVAIFTIHQYVGAYAGLTFSNTLCLSLFAVGIAICRHSPRPCFIWGAGNAIGLLIISPFLLHTLDGFSKASRLGGLSMEESSVNFIPAIVFPSSFFMGNWSELFEKWAGDASLSGFVFPFTSILLACGAAWCLIPILFSSARWRAIEILLVGMIVIMAILIIRPGQITAAMHHVVFFKSMRWPFREGLQFLFFIHVLLIIRHHAQPARLELRISLFSLAMFLLPLPFIRTPTFNPLLADRQALFSGEAEAFGARLKARLKSTDRIATVIDWDMWQKSKGTIPYSLTCTANFPVLYKIVCISGYSTTAPSDQVPLKTPAEYWFGAFRSEQVDKILAEDPNLVLITVQRASPLKLSLTKKGSETIDISSYLPK